MVCGAILLLLVLPAMGQAQTTRPDGRPLWIAVAAPGLVEAIEPLARRRAGQGFDIRILDDTVLRSDRQRSARDVEPIRKQVRELVGQARPLAAGAAPERAIALVLVGCEPGLPPPPGGAVRAADRCSLAGGAGSADNMAGRPSDAAIGDLDGDGAPDVSIGRLPARDAAELDGMIAKIVRFESQTAPAEWHHRYVLLGGSPQYGLVIDTLIETLVMQGLDRLDGRWAATVFYDSARSLLGLPAARLGPAALAAMADGAAMNLYMGHSSADGFFLRRADLERLKVRAGGGPLVCLSCLGGVQQAGADGFAVAAMRNPDGPVATFGAAQISYPQWNRLLAEGLERWFFNARPAPVRLADAIDGMRASLAEGRLDPVTLAALNLVVGSGQDLPAQRRGHLEMYSLFGDPATRLPWRLEELTLSGPERAAPGGAVRLTGRVGDARLNGAAVRWLVRRQFAAIPPSPGPAETPEARYARAGRVTLVEGRATVRDGRFEADLRLPPDLAGKFVVARAWAVGGNGIQAVGTCRIELSGTDGTESTK